MVYRRTPEVCARQARTRAALLDAARSLVAEHGLGGTGVARVADRAGVSVGTVYRYFPSKADLIGEVVREVCRRELDVVAAVAELPDTPPAERLVGAITTFARRAVRSGRTAYAVIAEPAEADVEMLRLEIRAELARILSDVVAEGVAAGDFPAQDPRVSGPALVGALSEVLVGPLAPSSVGDPQRVGAPDAHHGDAPPGTAADAALDEIGRLAIRAVVGCREVDR
jgi:AcrR family transcriptional regulator